LSAGAEEAEAATFQVTQEVAEEADRLSDALLISQQLLQGRTSLSQSVAEEQTFLETQIQMAEMAETQHLAHI
jgi:hypothetical protein